MPLAPFASRPRASQRRVFPLAATLAACVFASVPVALSAQHSGPVGGSSVAPPADAAQLNFLVGEWSITAKPKATTLAQRVHGVRALQGTWKAWRALDGWGVEDELRLSDASGNPVLLTHTLRFYDRAARRWANTAIDVYKGVMTQTTAERRGADFVVSGRGTDEDGRAFVSRATFSKVTPTGFTYRLDRSTDGGKTWTEGVTVVEARRTGAAASR